MLGRLFKQNSPAQAYPGGSATGPNPPSAQAAGSNFNSYEDSYTREILYGTHNPNQLKPYNFNNQLFRVIVSQDGGNLRSKQVLFDSANEYDIPVGSVQNSSFCKSPSVPRNSLHNRNILTSKIHHNSSELNDCMFGCGLPSNQTHSSTKIHLLPSLNTSVYGTSQSVLITRLFSITDSDSGLEATSDLSPSDSSTSWSPTPTMPIRETSIRNIPVAKNLTCQSPSMSNSNKPSNNNINSRFAIGVIIPLESLHDINDIIFNNWSEISHYLILLQKLTTKKLVHELNTSLSNNLSSMEVSPFSCPFIVNKRIQFPNYLLQNEQDLNNQIVKLFKLVHYNVNIPRLISSNCLIKCSVLKNVSGYNSMLLNWVLEVINWMEFKEGKSLQPSNPNYNPIFHNGYNAQQLAISDSNNSTNTNNTFLASLLALIKPFRESLSTKPYCNVQGKNTREITRVVLMTGNPVVAKKLIFIINALIPSNIISFSISKDSYEEPNDFNDKKNGQDKPILNRINNNATNNNNSIHPNPSYISNKPEEIDDYHDNSNEIDDITDEDNFSSSENLHSNKIKSSESSVTTSGASFNMPTPNGRQLSQSPNAESVLSNRSSPVITSRAGTQPIPIQSSNFGSSSRSEDSSLAKSSSSIKGWEIPRKSGAVTTTNTTSNKSRIEVSTPGIPITTPSNSSKERLNSSGSLSKSTSMSQLSSSLNSSLSLTSNYSLSKLGGSFMEKWKNSFGSYNSNNSNGNGHNIGSSYSNSSIDSPDYVPPQGFGSLSKRNSIQSLRTPSPAIEYEDFSWQPPQNHHATMHSNGNSGGILINNSSNSYYNHAHNAHSISGISMTPTKLSRTQSMFDLYNMHNNHQSDTLHEERLGSGVISDSKKGLDIKRTKTSIYCPLIRDNMVKNISENNRDVIRQKCADIMKLNVVMEKESDTKTLKVYPVQSYAKPLDYDDYDDPDTSEYDEYDDVESFTNDQSTITSLYKKKSVASGKPRPSLNRKSSGSVFKSKPLISSVAFSDEFRPEYNVQSCPINPKLESQVTMAMKNDLLFYQGNSNLEQVVSRTVFISLRAREIKVIEMSFNDQAELASSNQVGANEAYSQRRSSVSGGAVHGGGKTTYQTRIKKVYTPSKNSGNREAINKVENVLDEINQLFMQQQESYNDHNQNRPEERKKEGSSIGMSCAKPGESQNCLHENFTKKLADLVLRIID